MKAKDEEVEEAKKKAIQHIEEAEKSAKEKVDASAKEDEKKLKASVENIAKTAPSCPAISSETIKDSKTVTDLNS